MSPLEPSARRRGAFSAVLFSATVALLWPSVALGQDRDAGVPDGGPDGGSDGGSDDGWTEDDDAWAEEEDPEEEEPEEEEPEEEEPAEDPEGEAETEEGSEDEGETEGQAGGMGDPGLTVRDRPGAPPSADDDFTFVIPPILYQRQGGVQTIAGFPLFYLRESPQLQEGGQTTTELSIPPYYMMRGDQNWDVLFPLFYWFRGEGHHTWAIPPLWHHESTDGFDFGFAPLVMTGRHDDHHYTLIPPLLTIDWGSEHERFTFVANFWRIQERNVEHFGLFPFLWVENAQSTSYTMAPPFFFRFEDRNEGTELTIVPPFYHRQEPNGSYWGIPPLFHHNSGADFSSTTIFPLLSHFSEGPDAFRLVVGGLFWYFHEGNDETVVTPFYQRFRGATEMDAVAPFFFYIRDPRTDATTLAIPPLIWHIEDPASVYTVVFPFFGRFEERGRNTTWVTPLVANHQDHELGDETTWVFPTLQISRWHNGDAVNLHPIWYFESVPSHRYVALVPFWFDFEEFEGDQNRYTVLFPFFWRFREGNTTSTLILNTYHRERNRSDSWEWEFHFFPFFAYGESNLGHWWKIFEGLVGYERRGARGFATLFYGGVFQTDGPPPLQ